MPLFFYRGSEKSSERGNTSVSSENLLLVSPTFASYSAFSLQFSLSSALLPFLASGELYRIVGATPVQAGDTFKSTKVFRIVQINASFPNCKDELIIQYGSKQGC